MSNEIRLGIQSSPVNFGLGVNSGNFPKIATNLSGGVAIPTTFALSGESALFLGLNRTSGRNAALGEMHDTFGWTHAAHQFTFGVDATQFHYTDFSGTNPTVGSGARHLLMTQARQPSQLAPTMPREPARRICRS